MQAHSFGPLVAPAHTAAARVRIIVGLPGGEIVGDVRSVRDAVVPQMFELTAAGSHPFLAALGAALADKGQEVLPHQVVAVALLCLRPGFRDLFRGIARQFGVAVERMIEAEVFRLPAHHVSLPLGQVEADGADDRSCMAHDFPFGIWPIMADLQEVVGTCRKYHAHI